MKQIAYGVFAGVFLRVRRKADRLWASTPQNGERIRERDVEFRIRVI